MCLSVIFSLAYVYNSDIVSIHFFRDARLEEVVDCLYNIVCEQVSEINDGELTFDEFDVQMVSERLHEYEFFFTVYRIAFRPLTNLLFSTKYDRTLLKRF